MTCPDGGGLGGRGGRHTEGGYFGKRRMVAAHVEDAVKPGGITEGTSGVVSHVLYSLMWIIRVNGNNAVRGGDWRDERLGNKAFEQL